MSRAPLFRPEALAQLHRWRDVLIGAALGGLGLWLLPGPGLLARALGAVLGLLGAGLMLVAVRRLRLQVWAEGPGIVQVIEGQVAYFGPEGGGFAALDDLAALAVAGDDWVLTAADGSTLRIPRGARGVEALTDALVRLPGLDPSALLRAAAPGAPAVLWRRAWAPPQVPPPLPLTRASPHDRSLGQ